MITTAWFFVFSVLAFVGSLVLVRFYKSDLDLLAKRFFVVTILISGGAFIQSLLMSYQILPTTQLSSLLLQITLFRGWIVIGMALALAAILSATAFRKSENLRWWQVNRIALERITNAVCISVCLSFVTIEAAKLRYDGWMRQFFLHSGYSVPFMYFVMGSELAGATALLFRRARNVAALGLLVLMCGAVATHYRNGDPFSDSLDAMHLGTTLLCVLLFEIGARFHKGGGLSR